MAEPAPMAEPASSPAPGPDRSAVNSLLDQIETHLAKASKAKGHHASEHAVEIEKLVGQLDTHLASHAAGTDAYAKLKEHSSKLHTASKKGQHRDAKDHHHHMEAAIKDLRATL